VGIPNSGILLDSQSTVDVYMNKKLFTNIHDTKKPLSLHCNAGMTTVNKIGDLRGYRTVRNCEDHIANTVSLKIFETQYQVTYDK